MTEAKLQQIFESYTSRYGKKESYAGVSQDSKYDEIIKKGNAYARLHGIDQTPVAFINGAPAENSDLQEVH